MRFEFRPPDCGDMAFLLEREWLECNGRGGYASSTLACCNTRKYHGLVVANLPQPASGRHVLLSALHDSVGIAGQRVDLSGSQFRAQPLPGTCANLRRMAIGHCPLWEFAMGEAGVRKELLMPRDRDVLLIRYELLHGPPAVELRLKPLLAYRRNHHVGCRNTFLNGHMEEIDSGIRVTPYKGMPDFFLSVAGCGGLRVERRGEWYEGFFYQKEEERGYPAVEDLHVPAVLSATLASGTPVYVVAGTGQVADADELWQASIAERRRQASRRRARARRRTYGHVQTDFLDQLLQAGEQFRIVAPPQRPTIVAGYHWFEDWGRDTMIALPGLTFAGGELDGGFAVLNTFVQHARDGRIPNYIGPEGAEPTYNSVDATLWMFWTIQQYLRYGGSKARVREQLWPFMKQAVAHYAAGAVDDARMADNGLLLCGRPNSQLTWMDAAVDGKPVTPRWGHAVELNALWYNALCLCSRLGEEFGDGETRIPVAIDALAAAFRRTFWIDDAGYLADVVNETGVDRSLRPNQIFAVSMPFSPLNETMARGVVDAVERSLWTPFGLRTLAPDADGYRGQCVGDQATRDRAYHQGTVWPWLLGAFGESYLKIHDGAPAARQEVAGWLNAWSDHLRQAGIGSVSEIFDGDAPHAPRGCIAQAWSVAELTRLTILLSEDAY